MRHFKETLYRWVFTILAFASLLFLVGIILTLFRESYPLLAGHNLHDIVFGRFWYPTYDPPEFGMFPLIIASFVVTFGAMAVSVPIGWAPRCFSTSWRRSPSAVLKPVIEILAGIPSIVYGFFGMIIVAPLSRTSWTYRPGSMPLPRRSFWASWPRPRSRALRRMP